MLKIAGKTDVGIVRNNNQDAFAAGKFPDGAVWTVVCDGMGGVNGGYIASSKSVELIAQQIQEGYDTCMDDNGVRDLLLSATSAANAVVYEMACEDESLRGMGTTVVAVIVKNETAHIAYAGDSRAYLHTARGLEQLTRDHSMVRYLVDSGQLTEEEAKNHPRKNLITRALGVESSIDIDYCESALCDGEILLICSDGLSNFVEDDEMRRILLAADIESVPDLMIRQANAMGGGDNITVVVIAELSSSLPADQH